MKKRKKNIENLENQDIELESSRNNSALIALLVMSVLILIILTVLAIDAKTILNQKEIDFNSKLKDKEALKEYYQKITVEFDTQQIAVQNCENKTKELNKNLTNCELNLKECVETVSDLEEIKEELFYCKERTYTLNTWCNMTNAKDFYPG